MTPESDRKKLQVFETRVRQLILAYKELGDRYAQLQTVVTEKDKTIDALKAQQKVLEENYSNLKLGKMIDIGDDELRNAKSSIGKLVREIDKCIALLNV